MEWKQVLPGVWLFPDSCNVYAVECRGGMVCIDAGTGLWLRHIEDLPKPVVALLCTHYFRDHSAGAAEAERLGIPVYVPEIEEELFSDPEQHFRQRESYVVYDNIWDRYSPIEPIQVEGVLKDYDLLHLAGQDFEVVPLPGVTPGQIGITTTVSDGSRVCFCGEAIHSPGKVARIAPFQYNYNDFCGAIQCRHAARTLIHGEFDALLPSLGDPIRPVENALTSLIDNLDRLLAVRSGPQWVRPILDGPALKRVTDHVWQDCHSGAHTWYLLSEAGKVLALDYGYHVATSWAMPGYPKRDRRRALLHGLEALKSQFGIDRIEVVLVSHFHDDHVCGIPVLQRLFGTECWAAENFADLLTYPEAHTFPCNWPVPCKIQRRLQLDQPVRWEEYEFRLHPMSGHTRFASLIGFEADGKRFAHTGDQYFFDRGVESFENNARSQNHVYRNGALLDGYAQSGAWMLDWRPDIVIQGHQPAMFTDEHFFRHIAEWTNDYAELATIVMPLGADEVHFNLDSWGGWIWPYRVHLDEAKPFKVRATVRNPYPHPATIKVRLVGPASWSGDECSLDAQARAEVSCELSMCPQGTCRRQPIAIELIANGRPFGQVAEALVTIGHRKF